MNLEEFENSLEEFVKLSVDKAIVERILPTIKEKNYATCGQCGSLLIDARVLAKTIHDLRQEHYNSSSLTYDDDEYFEELDEILNSFIIYGAPKEIEEYDYRSYEKWMEDHSERHLEFLGEDCDVIGIFLEYSKVKLATNDKCKCFKECQKK